MRLHSNAAVASLFNSRILGAASVRREVGRYDRMAKSVHILAFSTSNYDAMIKFFRDFGFTVAEDPHDQLTPFFEHGRAARVRRGDLEFQLEESKSNGARASFNLFLGDSPDGEIERVKALGYSCDYQVSFYGEFHSFRSPDGGIFVL
jgi:catechol 2,3-dioxygenase-like lactoylglutathione lyase family enzyme